MQRFARFAVSFLSAAVATATLAADLRPLKDPAKIATVFPAAAKVRVVNVWATWCVPCVEEMPDLRAVDEAFGSDVAIVGVSLDDMIPRAQSAKVAAFLDKQKIAFPNVYYTGNADDLADRLDFSGEIPITIIYDRKGKELWRHQGRLDREQTIARVRELSRRMK
jgi:thiol-disulfide isomerase/thioredoxin